MIACVIGSHPTVPEHRVGAVSTSYAGLVEERAAAALRARIGDPRLPDSQAESQSESLLLLFY